MNHGIWIDLEWGPKNYYEPSSTSEIYSWLIYSRHYISYVEPANFHPHYFLVDLSFQLVYTLNRSIYDTYKRRTCSRTM